MNRKLGIAVLVLVTLLVLALFRRRPEPAAPPPPEPTPAPRKAEATRDDLFRAARLRRLKIGRTTIEATLSVKKACAAGDLDAIRMELYHSEKKKLLLSVEPLRAGDSGIPVRAQTVTPAELFSGGRTFSFPLPKADPPFHLGLYLCKDSSGTGRCREKPAANINDILVQYGLPRNGKIDPTPAEDKTYFFQYLLVEQRGEAASFETGYESDSAFSSLFRYVGMLPAVGKHAEAWQDGIAQAQERSQRINSMGLEGAGSGVSVVLPIFDKTVCPQRSPIPGGKK